MDMRGQRSDKASKQSTAKSRCQLAKEFLRQDAARLSGRIPIPLSSAAVECQRRKTMNKRFRSCSLARRRSQQEIKTREEIEDIKRDVVSSLSQKMPCPEFMSATLGVGVPLPGFRYHSNGDIRKLSEGERRRRQLRSLRAGFGHTQSTLDISWLPTVGHRTESDDLTLNFAREVREQSATMLRTLSRKNFRAYSSHETIGKLNTMPETCGVEPTAASCQFGGGPPHYSLRSKARISMNPFRPMVKPLTTSSMWCHGGEDLEKRETLIPTDSFNIKFGVSSRMLKERKSDLDEYRMKEEKKCHETNEERKKYIQSIKTM